MIALSSKEMTISVKYEMTNILFLVWVERGPKFDSKRYALICVFGPKDPEPTKQHDGSLTKKIFQTNIKMLPNLNIYLLLGWWWYW